MIEKEPAAEGESVGAPNRRAAPIRDYWIGIGLVTALAGRLVAANLPERVPNLPVFALFVPSFVLLAYWSYRSDAGPRRWLRALPSALFAFLVVEAFYWGVSLGGAAAAVGAFFVYTRLIRPAAAGTSGRGNASQS